MSISREIHVVIRIVPLHVHMTTAVVVVVIRI